MRDLRRALFCHNILIFGQSYSPLWAPSSSNQLQAGCINQFGQLVAGCTLTFSTHYYSGTNAHTHYSPTAPLSGITASCVTDSTGHCPVTVTTTIVGHAEYAEACATTCGDMDYAVGVPIYWVSDHGVWTFVGATAAHGSSTNYNHWMTSNAAYGIYNATVLYQASYPGLVQSNDMSLPYGGKFDLNSDWASTSQGTRLWHSGRY